MVCFSFKFSLEGSFLSSEVEDKHMSLRLDKQSRKICVPGAQSKRAQSDTLYYFIYKKDNEQVMIRVSPLIKNEQCIPVFADDMYIISAFRTARNVSLNASVYHYNNNDLTVISRLEKTNVDEVKSTLRLMLHLDSDDIINAIATDISV